MLERIIRALNSDFAGAAALVGAGFFIAAKAIGIF